MCCTKFSFEKSENNIEFDIVLFGGTNGDFFKTFLYLNIFINFDRNSNTIVSIKVNENLIDSNDIKKRYFDRKGNDIINDIDIDIDNNSLYAFGYECIINSNNESVIIIIGGRLGFNIHDENYYGRFICWFNTITKQFCLMKNVRIC